MQLIDLRKIKLAKAVMPVHFYVHTVKISEYLDEHIITLPIYHGNTFHRNTQHLSLQVSGIDFIKREVSESYLTDFDG